MHKGLRFLGCTAGLFLLFFMGASAQDGHFTEGGKEEFLERLEEVFSISADKRAARDFIEEVETFWLQPELDEVVQNYVMAMSDLLYSKRGRPFPDYQLYLTTVMAFQANQDIQTNFATWHEAMHSLLSQPRYPLRHANQLFQLAQQMLKDRVLYANAALQWTSDAPRFMFSFTDSLYLQVDKGTLTCRTSNDSIMVFDTGGKVNLMSGAWQGESGRITWQQSGLDPQRVYATFGPYKIDMGRNQLRVDSVVFYNKDYFSHALKGHLYHRVMSVRQAENSTFPKFESYEQRYQIEDIQPNFNYEGGFSQHGAKFLGSGTDQYPAEISIFRNDTLFITAKSLYFALRQDQIVSNTTEITMYLDSGNIYHPGLLFKYMAPLNEVHLIRDGEGLSRSPFFNTYHNVSMDTEMIRWRIGDPRIELRMLTGAAENHAFFESISYFREEFFNQLQGMDAIHPLQGLLNCSRYIKTETFTARDYARYLGISENLVRQQIIGLSFHGFVSYNVNTDTLVLRERLKDYLLFRAGNKDYDVIRFKSLTPGTIPNAILDLRNYDMELSGVEAISISDRQNVVFFPKEQRLTLKKDRNFDFDGAIASGMIQLYGNSFRFNYEDFRIDLNIIDSMAMRMETQELDYFGRPAQRKINSTIARLSGYLEIDRADNKSGKESYAEYPRLTSNTNSFVYYDQTHIQNGAYDRESFYFELDPFEIDSVSRLTRENIAFTGTFKSGIFPNMEEVLVVRPDYSLGFRKETPEDGLPIYDERATYSSTLDLSNQGLKGNGTLAWLTSTAQSEDFTFLPRNTEGLAHDFNIAPVEKGIEFPDVQGRFARVNYLPYEDQLLAEMQEEPFTLFNQEAHLEGTLTIQPGGLEGSGLLNMPNASLGAARLDLTHHTVMADSADFNLVQDESSSEIDFRTSNVLATVDFKSRIGNFTAHDPNNTSEFTDLLYMAYISEFSWQMDKNDIYIGSPGSDGNRFVSTHRRQDSLDFLVPLARYDAQNNKLYAQEVKYVDVADTRMFLNDGNIVINRGAVLDPLDSVRIALNDSLHHFYNAKVQIEGKNAYEAEGLYDYINGAKAVKTITFSSIKPNSEITTVAEGEISDRELFTFDRRFTYKGGVRLTGGHPLLHFKGGAQMLHDQSVLGPNEWVRFDAEIDPEEVRIPMAEQPENFEFERIFPNFFLNRDSNIIYSAFLEPRRFHSDVPVVSAKGFLFFDEASNAFAIAEKHKIEQPDTTGNILRFHNSDATVTGEGTIDMGLPLDQVKTHAAGTAIHHRGNGQAEFMTLFGLDFMLEEESINLMVNGLRSAEAIKGKPFENNSTINRMAEWMGKKTATDVAREVQGFEPMRSLPAENQYTLVFDSLTWRWDERSRSYIADTEAYIGWVRNQPIHRKVKVQGTISFSRGGNSLDLYIDLGKDNYFFFGYRNGLMQTRSSMEAFNTHVQALKPDERKLKTGLGEKSYTFALAPESRVKRLLRQFQTGVIEDEELNEEGELIEEEVTQD